MAREITGIAQYITNNRISIIVKPNSKNTEVLGFDKDYNALRINIRAAPTDGKANEELLKFLKKQTGRPCEIQSGSTSRRKIIRFY